MSLKNEREGRDETKVSLEKFELDSYLVKSILLVQKDKRLSKIQLTATISFCNKNSKKR